MRSEVLAVCVGVTGLLACPVAAVAEPIPEADLSNPLVQKYIEASRKVYLLRDSDDDGAVTLEENAAYFDRITSDEAVLSDPVFRAAYRQDYLKDDRNGDGLVTAEEFGLPMYESMRENFISLDADGDGELSFQECIHPAKGAEGALDGRVSGTSFRYGATVEEVSSPKDFPATGVFDANYAAYVGHAFARWDKDESFSLSFSEFIS